MSKKRLPKHVERDCLPGAGQDGVCDRCLAPLVGRRVRWCSDACADWFRDNHRYTNARWRVRERDGACVRCGSAYDLEVDHIVAAKGQHGVISCIHHQDNLRALCHDCHAWRTRLQKNPAFARLAGVENP
jgi:5-methylcytosine-specific restriction endonuclease McrA